MLETLVVNWHTNPELFSIGPISLRWYSLLFISGFILGWYIFKWFFKREGVTFQQVVALCSSTSRARSSQVSQQSASNLNNRQPILAYITQLVGKFAHQLSFNALVLGI